MDFDFHIHVCFICNESKSSLYFHNLCCLSNHVNPFVYSLVVLAVPNGPVYELVVKGSAIPKEDDK